MQKTAKKSTVLARTPKPRSPRTQLAAERRKLDVAAAAYAGASRAENTKRAYTNDFVTFSAWCREQGLTAMPALPRTVALYLTALAVAEKKVATIERALVAISQAHKHSMSSCAEFSPEVEGRLTTLVRVLLRDAARFEQPCEAEAEAFDRYVGTQRRWKAAKPFGIQLRKKSSANT